MTILFFDGNGSIGRARRPVSGVASVSETDVSDPSRLADIIRQLSVRVSGLEAMVPPTAMEFQVTCEDGEPVRLNHGFGCPVRFYVTHWAGNNTDPCVLTYDASASTDTELVLDSWCEGVAIVRVEQAQAGPS